MSKKDDYLKEYVESRKKDTHKEVESLLKDHKKEKK